MKKRIKIFDYTWHIPHQYDLAYALREDADFFHCLNIKRQWDTSVRPVPDNLYFVTSYEKNKYDIAILHLDQQIIDPATQKKLIYSEFDEIIKDIPIIVINHGTPVYPEWFHSNRQIKRNDDKMKEECIKSVRELVRDRIMVVNSHTSASCSEWGFGRPIVHGINPNDWHDHPKELRVFTALA